MSNTQLLITGTNSGLGKFLWSQLGGQALTRSTSAQEWEEIRTKKMDVIIHCAFNAQAEVTSSKLSSYLEDNFLLTQKLISLSPKKFIYISSVDVYPFNQSAHTEEEDIPVHQLKGIYATTKLMAEAIVRQNCQNYLILRPSFLLGPTCRKNSLVKMIENDQCTLSLSGDSVCNYVRQEDLLSFIKESLTHDFQGIYNATSTGNIQLNEIAGLLNKKINFGNFRYLTGNVRNEKIVSVCPIFKKTSKEVVLAFAEQLEKSLALT